MKLRKRSITKKIESNNDQYERKKQKRNPLIRISRIEDLSGEIWFEIFSYFDGHSLVNSFLNLNSSIESLLNDYRLPVHINILCSSFSIPNPLNFNQIVSLKIDYTNINNTQIIDISSFVRLHSLSLIKIDDRQLESLSKVPLNYLYRITVQSKCAKFLTKILSVYFPNLKWISLNSMDKEFVVKSYSNDQIQISQIEKLILNGRIKLAKLARLWPYVPNLQSFSIINGGVHQCDYWIDQHLISYQKFPHNLSFIHIKIFDDDMTFSNLERLIPKSVRYLIISGSIADDDFSDYLSPTNWIQLISCCSNKLKCVKLDISSHFDPSDASGLRQTLLKFRKSSFFRHAVIQSKIFLITIKGFIHTDLLINE